MFPAIAAAAGGHWFEPSGEGFTARGSRYSAAVGGNGFEAISLDGKPWRAAFAASSGHECQGVDQRLARSNYIVGKHASHWRLWVPQYERVRCREAYPGIDVVYSLTREGLLEFDLELAAGADATAARIIVDKGGAAWSFRKPAAWQTTDGKRQAVQVELRRDGGGAYGYRLGEYDRRRPLVIDPVVDYATYLGATGGASGEAVAVDKEGNIYVVGTVTSNTFPTSDDAMQPLFAGSNDIFVSKFDTSGSTLLYSTYLGSYLDDRAVAIAVDGEGRLHVTGYTTSPEFPTKGAIQERFAGGSMAAGGDVFVFILDRSGSALLFSTYLGGTLDDFGRAIAIAPDGGILIAGGTNSQDFPLQGAQQAVYGGGPRDAFVLRLAPLGEKLVYSTFYGGSGNDEFYGVAAAADGSAIVTGITTTNDLTMTEGAIQARYGGGARDVLLGRLGEDGSVWRFLTYLGGTADDWGRAITLDGDGDIYLTGYTTSSSYPRVNSFDITYNSNRDAFLTKVKADGSALVYSGFIGHNSLEDGFAIAVNEDKEATVVGHTQSLQFPLNNAVQSAIGTPTCRTQPCTADLFIAKFSADGRRYLFSSYLGGTGADQSRGVALSAAGDAWVTGYTASVNFPFMNGLFPRHGGGGANVAFAVKITYGE